MLPKVRVLKSVAGPRSVANAMVFPSGDQEGWRSANLSLVRRCRPGPSTLTTNRSDSPPPQPVNTICFPSGRQVGLNNPVKGAVRALPGEGGLGEVAGAVVLGELGEVCGLPRVPPFAREVVERKAQGSFERVFDSARCGRLEDLPDDFVAPFLTDVRPDRVAEVIGENPRVVGQLFDRGEVALKRRVT